MKLKPQTPHFASPKALYLILSSQLCALRDPNYVSTKLHKTWIWSRWNGSGLIAKGGSWAQLSAPQLPCSQARRCNRIRPSWSLNPKDRLEVWLFPLTGVWPLTSHWIALSYPCSTCEVGHLTSHSCVEQTQRRGSVNWTDHTASRARWWCQDGSSWCTLNLTLATTLLGGGGLGHMFCTGENWGREQLRIIFLNILLIFERKKDSVNGGEAEREGDTESEAGSRLRAVGTEPGVGLELTNREVMTWVEVGRSTDWAMQTPQSPWS